MPHPDDLPGTELLRLARSSIEHGLVHSEPLPVNYDALPRALAEHGASFTTLRRAGELRGCRGTLEATEPLAIDVVRSAFLAAFSDPRFDPVSEHELAAIRLEVSVLSPMLPVPATGPEDLLQQLTPGVDGLVIIEGGRRATFLPDVWQTLPEPGNFLARLKVKCGLTENYWSESLEFRRYRTTSYAESG